MNEGVPLNKTEVAGRIFLEHNLEIHDNCVDLTNLPLEDLLEIFKAIIDTNEFVLHGTNSPDVYKCLERRQGRCLLKESGRKNAVYATTVARVPLGLAVLNRNYIAKMLGGPLKYGWSGNDTSLVFRFPVKVLELLKSGNPNVFGDGYVYVLDKNNFVNAEDAGSEWHAEEDQEPVIACKISKNIAPDMYKAETLTEFIDPKDR